MSKKLTVVPPQLPALTPWPSRKQMAQLAAKLDMLVDHYKNIWALVDDKDACASEDGLALARRYLRDYERSSVRAVLLSGELERLHKECIPADWWSDEDVQESAVARMVTTLLSSFPNGAKDPEIFVPQMIEDVHAWEPHFLPLHDACRELRESSTFTPSTAELKQAYDNALVAWRERWDAEDYVEDVREQLIRRVEKAELTVAREREQAEQRRKYLEAKRAPLVVGDLVRHKEHGTGIITDYPCKSNVCWVWWDALDRSWLVRFDHESDPVCVWADQLERLVEGDEGFEPPAE